MSGYDYGVDYALIEDGAYSEDRLPLEELLASDAASGVGWHKTRGEVGREEWMCQMFGNDWRTNGRVAMQVEPLRPKFKTVAAPDGYRAGRLSDSDNRMALDVARSMGLDIDNVWLVKK